MEGEGVGDERWIGDACACTDTAQNSAEADVSSMLRILMEVSYLEAVNSWERADPIDCGTQAARGSHPKFVTEAGGGVARRLHLRAAISVSFPCELTLPFNLGSGSHE
jgi:hypothetical protein